MSSRESLTVVKKILSIALSALRIGLNLMAILFIALAAYLPSDKMGGYQRFSMLAIGIWLLSMDTIDRRLKSIDESLTMIAMSSAVKDIGGMVKTMHSQWKEMKKDVPKACDCEEARAKEDTAKAGALE